MMMGKRPDPGLTPGPGDSLVAHIKELQRSDQTAKEQWWVYCDTQGGGVRDPAKHNPEFLQTFIAQYNAGHLFEVPEGGRGSAGAAALINLSDLFKDGQRKSQAWKKTWALYCQHYGGGINDPNKHEPHFLVGFMDFLGNQGSMALSGGMAPMGMMQPMAPMGMMGAGMAATGPAAKRMKTVGGIMGPMTGDPMKDMLVSRIKTYQRSGEEAKQTWWSFCDTNFEGIRDPARHEVTTLQQFITENGVP